MQKRRDQTHIPTLICIYRLLQCHERSCCKNNAGFIDMETIFAAHYDKFLNEGGTEYHGLNFGILYKRDYSPYYRERFGSDEMMRITEWNYIFKDYCHPMPVGNFIIAESIYKYLTDNGYIIPLIYEQNKIPPIRQKFQIISRE